MMPAVLKMIKTQFFKPENGVGCRIQSKKRSRPINSRNVTSRMENMMGNPIFKISQLNPVLEMTPASIQSAGMEI
jgi:hypothetical protein